MKVLLLNGSPKEHGCTYTALCEVARALNESGVETETLWIGNRAVRGCIGCGGCAKNGRRRCVFEDDLVNAALDRMQACDGLVVGSPVHYAAAGGSITSFLDRMFYAGGSQLRTKVGAAVCSARRAGTTAALDQLVKYPMISNMPVVSSQYWPMVHGARPEDVAQDEEGLQTMRQLARNLLWLLQCIAAGDAAGVPRPETEARKFTNFIR